MEVMSSNPGWVELGVHGTSVVNEKKATYSWALSTSLFLTLTLHLTIGITEAENRDSCVGNIPVLHNMSDS